MEDLGGAGGVLADFGHLIEAGAEALDQLPVKGAAGGGQGIEDPLAVFADDHEPDAAKVGEMPGSGRLGDAKDLEEIVDTQLALAEEMQDAKASAVGERAEDRVSTVPSSGRFRKGLRFRHSHRPIYAPRGWSASGMNGWR